MTLEQYTNTQISSVEGQILESNGTTLGNLPAHEIVFTNNGLKTMQVWTLKDDKVYTITYVAEEDDYENDLRIAQRIIESFEYPDSNEFFILLPLCGIIEWLFISNTRI